MHRRLLKQARAMCYRAAFRVVRAIIESRDPSMSDGTSTHCARLKRHPQIAACEPVIPQKRCGFPHRDDFGMCGGVMAFERAVGPATDNLPVLYDNCAHRNFACLCGFSRQKHGFFHHFAGFGQRHGASLADIAAFDHSSG